MSIKTGKTKVNKYFYNERGKRVSEKKMVSIMRSKNLTLADYENVRKFIKNNGKKNRSKFSQIYEIIEQLSGVNEYLEDHEKIISFLRNSPKNIGRAFLNGKRISKNDLADKIIEIVLSFRKPFKNFYLVLRVQGVNYSVNVDGQISKIVNLADISDGFVTDRFGNEVFFDTSAGKNKRAK